MESGSQTRKSRLKEWRGRTRRSLTRRHTRITSLVPLVLLAIVSLPFPGTVTAAETTPAELRLSESRLTFIADDTGELSQTLTLTHAREVDSAPIEIQSVYLDEKDALLFSTDFTGPVTLDSGDTYALTVRVEPNDTPQAHTGLLYLSHSGAQGVSVVHLDLPTPLQHRDITIEAKATSAIGFVKSTLSGTSSSRATSLQFGPDERLYVADMMGTIKVYTVERIGASDYQVTATEVLNQIRDIPNHDDDGTPNASVTNRLLTGILVTGTAAHPVIYALSSDPRFGGGTEHTDTHLDTNSTLLSRLDWDGGEWVRTDLVRGLPRSEENHHGNGIAMSADGNTLYLAMGGNTNAGAVSHNFALLPEFALSAAILEVDLLAIGNTTYDLPTLDDEDRPGAVDANDPFGGNQGKNQAILLEHGPVTVYAPGFRNPYDIVITERGRMYSIDNGPNAGWGSIPVGAGPAGTCTNGINEPGKTRHDDLHLITGKGYYGGHANPTRGNVANTFNASNPQSPVQVANPIECDYQVATSRSSALLSFPVSTNGLDEYTASNFSGQLKGDLLAAGWDNTITRIQLDDSGAAVTDHGNLFSNVGTRPLDVIAQGDDEIFPGTIWVADLADGHIAVFEPVDYGNGEGLQCDGNDSSGDADDDGYSNQDELLNQTDPCSAADVPADFDGDFQSDLLDNDDDNDGLDDTADPFALDAANGASTSVPLRYDWENDSSGSGGILNLGFTGLMLNGSDTHSTQYDPYQITAGGAAGVLTIDNVTAGDAYAAKNSQEYGFQFGINVTAHSPPFVVHTRILAPFAGLEPGQYQSMGLFFGTGDQDNYIKLVINGKAPAGGVQFLKEQGGRNITVYNASDAVLGADAVDLYLHVDPITLEVHASYQLAEAGLSGPVITLPDVMPLPQAWLTQKTRPAVGVIATSIGGEPYAGTWDLIDVQSTLPDDEPGNAAPQVNAGADQTVPLGASVMLSASVSDDGQPNDTLTSVWSKVAGPGEVSFDQPDALATAATFTTSGTYQLRLTVSDGELTAVDVLTLVVTDVTPPTPAGVVYRINVGGPAVADSNGDWLADASASGYVNTGVAYARDVPIDTSKLTTPVPKALFTTHRWDGAAQPEMHWQLPVTPGEYTVRLYFAEIWPGAYANSVRVFTGSVEGTPLPDIDLYALAGQQTAYMIEVPVVADATLDITLQHLIQNPLISAIEVVSVATAGNQAPRVDLPTSLTTSVDTPLSLNGVVSDDGLPDGTLDLRWSQVNGAGTASFSSHTLAQTIVSFSGSGDYRLRLTATDGELTASADIQVHVEAAPILPPATAPRIRINAGGPTLSDPDGDWLAASEANVSVNTGFSFKTSNNISTAGLPYSVPKALFQTERWDAAPGPELHYAIPVEPGEYEVRLYFAEIWAGAASVGKRVFGVEIEGQSVGAIDVFQEVGLHTAMVRRLVVRSDETLDIRFSHIKENPAIKGIEILALATEAVNQAPIVTTGPDITTEQQSGIRLSATVSDDGLPDGTLRYQWRKMVGPGSVIFSDASVLSPTVSVSEVGNYLLGLTASDGELEGNDALGLYVVASADNTAPVVNAGEDITVTAGNVFDLNATVSDDGLPDGALTLNWSKVSGPGVVHFAKATQAETTVSIASPGLYVLRLSVSDGALSTTDELQVQVESVVDPAEQTAIRINAGGPAVSDASGDWVADSAMSAYVNTGRSYTNAVAVDQSGLAATVPAALFHTSRWDPASAPEMAWRIPVSPGSFDVRLYFAETWPGAFQVGKRVFALDIEGTRFNAIDVFAAAGAKKAMMLQATVQADSVLDIVFSHIAENPSVNAIEIIPRDAVPGGTTPGLDANTAWQLTQTIDGSHPDARHEAGAVAVGGQFYLLGGRGNRAVNRFEPNTQKWTTLANPPRVLHHFQPVAIANKIYVIGAMGCCYPTEENVHNIYIYNPDTKAPRRVHASATAATPRLANIYLPTQAAETHPTNYRHCHCWRQTTGRWRTRRR